MLDLDTRIDLNEVVAVLLVNEELRSACIAIVDRLGQSNGVSQDVVSDFGREILGGSNFDDLLVSSLDGAVTLVQVDNVTMVVTKELDLNVLGLVKEALDEDGSVAEGSLGLGGGTLEGLLQSSLLADDSHTSATTTVSGLDDDGEAILVGEVLDLLKPLDSALGTRDDGHVGLQSQGSGRDLVTEGVDYSGGGTDELAWWGQRTGTTEPVGQADLR